MKKILIIENEEFYKNILINKLSNEGFEVISAKNNEGFFLAINEKPDLILLDLSISFESDISLFKKIREHNTWGKSVPVFVLSVFSSKDEKINKMITELEPVFYLQKSEILVSSLVEKIKEKFSL